MGQFRWHSTSSASTSKAIQFYVEVHGPTNLLCKSSIIKKLFLVRKYSNNILSFSSKY